MGGRGSMSMTSGGADVMDDQAGKYVEYDNERRADREVVLDFINTKIQSVKDFPEIQGQLYNEISSLTVADIHTRGVGGFYDPSSKKIVIGSKLVGTKAQAGIVSHEFGHGVGLKPPKGFRSDVETVKAALDEYRQTHPRASDVSFAATISNYATKSYGETFAEAFKDVSINGKNAKPSSKLVMKHWKR